MAAAAVDVGYLAASYAIPEPTLHTLLSSPTVELVQSLVVQIEAKAREYDELRSEKLRADVELENAVRSGETRARALKASADKALKDAEELRQKLSQEENARQQVETELQNLKSSATNSSTEVEVLRSRITSLEARNRDTITSLDSKSSQYDNLHEDLKAQQQKTVQFRKQVSALEEKIQTLENEASSAKFRENNLQKEIQLLKKDNEWYEAELKTRNADHTKFRKDKMTRIAELQRANTDANQSIDSLRRTETSLRNRIEELDQKTEHHLNTISQLQEQARQDQETSRAETITAKRLATLSEDRYKSTKARLDEVEHDFNELKEGAASELGLLQAEVDSERSQREAGENKIKVLESQVERLEFQITELSTSIQQPPATPRRAINGPLSTPGRTGSPSIGSPSRGRGAMTQTQTYAENAQLRAENRKLKEEVEISKATVQEMIDALERAQPELEEMRQENERLLAENGQMTSLLEEAVHGREEARKETRKCQGDYKGLLRESDLQRQQLRDLSAQIRLLLVEQQIREEGIEALTVEQQEYLKRVAINDIPVDEMGDTTDTGRLISRQLVIFRNVSELQNRNEQILRTIRDVAEQYEGTEAQIKANQMEKDREELTRLRDKISQHEEEIKSLQLKSQGFMKERDMYRRIVTSRGQIPPDRDISSAFGQSVNDGAAATPPPGNSVQGIEQSPQSKERAEYAQLYKDLQAYSDNLRQEYTADRTAWKEQVDRLSKENMELQGQVLRLNNAALLAQERYDLVQSKLNSLKSENNELLNRSQSLQDLAAKQDLRTQQVAEEVVEWKSKADSLKRENDRLNDAKSLSRSREERLTKENEELLAERNRQNAMITSLQNLQLGRDQANDENRRRLESRAASLEIELQDMKRKLEDELEEHRKISLRREYEQTETRKKLEDLTTALNNIRPELASTKTERDQLQARVDELKVELRIAEERADGHATRLGTQANGSADDDLSREEQLSIEISGLKREIEATREAMEGAKADVEQYKAIAQESEERLESTLDTQEQYENEMNQQIAKKDAKIRDLEKRVDEISSELATTNAELNELRGKHEEETARLGNEKELLEAEITRWKDDADREREKATLLHEDLKAQADIANRAQQNYESELLKHSQAMQSLRDVREEHNQLKTEVAQIRAESEAARTSLAQSEELWAETRERYERELAESRSRHNDLSEQNKILHRQLENVSNQIAGLKQSRVSVDGGEPDSTASDVDVAGLREVIKYLRQEKEIVDIQYEMQLQENKRQRNELDYALNQLDQAREQLSTERQSQAQTKQNAASLESLQNTVEQLNLYRESVSTLRNEARQAQARLAEKTKEVENLYEQIQPLKGQVQDLEGQLGLKNGEIELLEKDRDHWQQRHQTALQKFDRIDPAELEALKTQIETLQTDRDQAREEAKKFGERLKAEKEAALQEANAAWEERKNTMVTQFKERSRMLSGQIKEKDATNKAITEERDELKEQLAIVQQELDAAKSAHDEAIANANSANSSADVDMGEEGQVTENSGTGLAGEQREELEARIAAAERQVFEERNRYTALQIHVQQAQERVRNLETQVGELQQRIGTLNTELSQAQEETRQAEAQLADLQTQQAVSEQAAPLAPSEEAEKLRKELAVAQKEIEDLRTRADITDYVAGQSAEDGSKTVDEQVAEQVATFKAEANGRVKEADDKWKEKMNKMRDKFNNILKEEKGKNAQLQTDHEAQIEQLTTEHQAELARAREAAQSAATQNNQTTAEEGDAKQMTGPGAGIETAIKAEALPASDATDNEVRKWIDGNMVAREIIKRNITDRLKKERDVLKEEQDKAIAEKVEEAKASFRDEQDKIIAERVKEAITTAKKEQEKAGAQKTATEVESTKAKVKEEQEKRFAVKINMLNNQLNRAKAQLAVVQEAATETPERAVGEVWAIAKDARPQPTPRAQAPAGQPAPTASALQANQTPQTQVESPIPSQPTHTSIPQANGAMGGGGFGQPSFPQAQQGNVQTSAFGRSSSLGQNQAGPLQQFAQNPFSQPSSQAGAAAGSFSGLAQPSFGQSSFGSKPQTTYNNNTNIRPDSPFGQQQQQAGRGRGDHIGTGPAALRNLVGQQAGQSSIPRGGGIPRPSGRGQGNQNQNQSQGINVHGAGASQIGRGGGSGSRRGRGGGQIQTNAQGGQGQGQEQNSPRSLNPGAQQFHPGIGRGQKRGRDGGDDGDPGHQGGKRPRGGGGGSVP